mmetsp:Transcript_23420/g.69517  ORF Transcript_23420/g.69517 Transcript_23420/m.69517 type:complete len:235 (-) Transcript_23420:233-937(-)
MARIVLAVCEMKKRSCDTMSTVPSNCCSASSSTSLAAMSRWLVGSSSSSTCGSCSSALPSPIRIFHPPEKAVTGSSASDGENPIALIILSARFSMAPASDASSCACSSAIVSSAPCIASASSPAAASAASASSYRARSESTSEKTESISSRSERSSRSSSRNSCRRKATLMSADDLTISPPSSSSSPARTRSCVVLPAPLFPTRPTRCPVCTSQLASVSTSWLRNRSWPPLILR